MGKKPKTKKIKKIHVISKPYASLISKSLFTENSHNRELIIYLQNSQQFVDREKK